MSHNPGLSVTYRLVYQGFRLHIPTRMLLPLLWRVFLGIIQKVLLLDLQGQTIQKVLLQDLQGQKHQGIHGTTSMMSINASKGWDVFIVFFLQARKCI